jgi:DNA-binding SARP family transcriptional activator
MYKEAVEPMITAHLPNYSSTSDASLVVRLIQRGLNYIQRGYHAEGVAIFELAREQLVPGQESLAASLDMFVQGYEEYRSAQQAHQEASMRFARAHTEQQARVAAFGAQFQRFQEEIPVDHSLPHSYTETIDCQPPPSSDSHPHSSSLKSPVFTEHDSALPALHVTCFGRFEVRRVGQQIALCTNRSGQTILRYLITQPGRRASVDKLMDICWPEDGRSVALHKLRVAMSALRGSLNKDCPTHYGSGYILCKAKVYQLNPAVHVRTDADDFLTLYRLGREAEGHSAIELYEAACNLYTGPFLVEDLYADWSLIQRTQFSNVHLIMCSVLADHYLRSGCYEATIKWATEILKENPCDENAHRQIMYTSALEGRRDEAVRQYQLCEHILREELSMTPMAETVNLLQRILNGEVSLPAN